MDTYVYVFIFIYNYLFYLYVFMFLSFHQLSADQLRILKHRMFKLLLMQRALHFYVYITYMLLYMTPTSALTSKIQSHFVALRKQ